MDTSAFELSAAELFDSYTGAGPARGSFDVVGSPDQPLGVSLRAGDLVLARARGLPHASVSVVAEPSLRTHEDLDGRRPPGRYAAVVGAPAREPARLVTDLNGVVTPNIVILRPAQPAEAEDDAGLWVPGAELMAHPKSGGLAYLPTAPWRFVFHTIEGRPSVDAFRALARRHASPPHLWAMPSANLLLQVIPLNRGAYALGHPSGTVHTNKMRAIQVECWGYARDMGDASADVLDWLADRVLGPVAALVPLDLSNVRATGGEDCYGLRSPCRMTDAEWAAFDGVCGHQHVPHNAHWDPGQLDLRAIASRATRARGAATLREAAVDAAMLATDEAEPEEDTALHGEASDDAEGTEKSNAARLEWVDLATMVGPFGRPEVYYLTTGAKSGGPSVFRLKVTNTNSVKNFQNTTLKVRLRRRTEPRESAVIPLEGQGDKPWKAMRSEEIPDESSRIMPIDLGAATMRRAYDPDEPQRWLDVEFHWFEKDLFGYSAYYTSTSRAFYLVAPVELLLKKKHFVGERPLDNQAEHAAHWQLLWQNSDPAAVEYKLTLQRSSSNTWGGQFSVTSATTTTRGTERSQQQTISSEASLEFGVKDMFTIGQKVGSSVTTGIQWSESVERAMTFAASRSQEFTTGHSQQAEIAVKIPAAPKGRKKTLYAYPVVGLWEVPVVLYGGGNELGQATRRSTGTVPVVWLRGWGTQIVST